MACKVLEQELYFGFGKTDQTDYATANDEADLLWFRPVARPPLLVNRSNSDDADMAGKGHEFPTRQYKEAANLAGESFQFYTCPEVLAWLTTFGLGASTKSGASDPFTYTATAKARGVDPCALRPFTIAQLDGRSTKVVDQALIGCVVNGFTIDVQSGAERSTSMTTVDVIGTGREARPSTYSIGTVTEGTDLISASLALTALSVDYVTAARINSLRLSWDNDVQNVFRPGGGVQNGFALANQFESGRGRSLSLEMNVDFSGYTTELDKIRDHGEGTIVLSLEASASRKTTITLHKVQFAGASFESDGRGLNLNVSTKPMRHASNGLITVATICGIDGIGE